MLTLPFMLLDLQARLKGALRSMIRTQWNIDPPDIVLNQTPKVELGELATPVAFELARHLKKPPRAIAEELVAKTGKVDVIVGLKHVERKSFDDVRQMASKHSTKFDYYCWDVYARVTAFYAAEDPKYKLRAQTLKEIEEGGSETAKMAEIVAMTIVRYH